MAVILKKAVLCILAAMVILAACAGIIFHNEIRTATSIHKIDTNFSTMKYHGDYGFDEFLKVGAGNDAQLIEFVSRQILKG